MSLKSRSIIFFIILCTIKAHKTTTASNITRQELNNVAALRQSSFWEWLQGIANPTRAPTTTTTSTTTPVPASERECAPCDCGLMNRSRIVGGQATEMDAYPWMTLVLLTDNFACGGSLINDRYILTAAHCVKYLRVSDVSLRLLEYDRQNSPSYVINRNVSEILIHDDYDPYTYDNDIALVKLSEPVEWNERLRPICMPPNADNDYAGEIGIVTGWGRTSESGSTSNLLKEVEVPIWTQEDCRSSTTYDPSFITDNMLCAGNQEGGMDACQKDSGGPLHVRMQETSGSQQRYLLAGIFSWGAGCGRPKTPGVYTRVTRYLEWISQQTGDACGCEMQEVGMEELDPIHWWNN